MARILAGRIGELPESGKQASEAAAIRCFPEFIHTCLGRQARRLSDCLGAVFTDQPLSRLLHQRPSNAEAVAIGTIGLVRREHSLESGPHCFRPVSS